MSLKNVTIDNSGCFFPLKQEMSLLDKSADQLFEQIYGTFQSMVFYWANSSIANYNGGSWDLCRATTENGSFHFLKWQNEDLIEFNASETPLASDLAGLVLSMMAWSHLSFYYYKRNDDLCDFASHMYHRARHYIWNSELNGYIADKAISSAIFDITD